MHIGLWLQMFTSMQLTHYCFHDLACKFWCMSVFADVSVFLFQKYCASTCLLLQQLLYDVLLLPMLVFQLGEHFWNCSICTVLAVYYVKFFAANIFGTIVYVEKFSLVK